MTFACVTDTDLLLIHSNKLNYTQLEDTHLARISRSGTAAPLAPPASRFPAASLTAGWFLCQTVVLSPSSPPGCSRRRSTWSSSWTPA